MIIRATTEDELLKDEKAAAQEAEEKPQEVQEDDCDEAESCSVSLRSSNKQVQSLPPTPRSTDSSLVRSSTAQSAESVNSTKHLLSTSSTPVTQV